MCDICFTLLQNYTHIYHTITKWLKPETVELFTVTKMLLSNYISLFQGDTGLPGFTGVAGTPVSYIYFFEYFCSWQKSSTIHLNLASCIVFQ